LAVWPLGAAGVPLPLFDSMLPHASVSCPDNGLNPVSALATRDRSLTIGCDTRMPILDCSRPLSATVVTEPLKFRVVVKAWY
jgi:hypothetical protein